jgi:AraC-like DNA-binding protein
MERRGPRALAPPRPILRGDRVRKPLTAIEVFPFATAPGFVVIGHFPPDEDSSTPHSHEFIEILMLIEGEGIHVSADGPMTMTAGTVAVVRPGAWHGFARGGGGLAMWMGISLESLSTDLSTIRRRAQLRDLLYAGPLGRGARGVWTTQVPGETVERVAEEADRLSALLTEHPDEMLPIVGQVITTLGILSTGFAESSEHGVVHPSVALLLDLLESRPQHAWSVAELASRANVDSSYLSRIFRAQVGLPPMTYLSRLRAERAAQLLAATERSVAQVGRDVGWRDPTHFSRRFHELIGLTPTEYRRQLGV